MTDTPEINHLRAKLKRLTEAWMSFTEYELTKEDREMMDCSATTAVDGHALGLCRAHLIMKAAMAKENEGREIEDGAKEANMRPRLKISIAALAGSLVVSFILWVAFIALCVKLGRAWGWL